MKKARDPNILPPRGAAITDTILAKLGSVVEMRDVIILAKFQIKRVIIIVSSVRS